MGRAERSTAGRPDGESVVVVTADGVVGVPVADIAAPVVAGLAELLHDARRIAATTAPLLVAELLR
jgi:hypothetical protein